MQTEPVVQQEAAEPDQPAQGAPTLGQASTALGETPMTEAVDTDADGVTLFAGGEHPEEPAGDQQGSDQVRSICQCSKAVLHPRCPFSDMFP